MNIYTVLLVIALISLLMACVFLYLEIREFGGFGAVKGRVAMFSDGLLNANRSFWA
ncbi:MAG: hypothetical protein KDA57_08250 [Planctomycetales bacterium]|nr:hypothetical protein [Planctomycetales bacterium]